MAGTKFPMDRRTADGRHFYRILASDHFIDVQRVGERWMVHEVHARAYPELVRIQEMLVDHGRYPPMGPGEWDRVLALARGEGYTA